MKESFGDRIFMVFNYVLVTLALIVVLYPLIYIVSASISDPTHVNSGQMWLYPIEVTFEGYKRVFSDPEIWLGYRNTIFYTVCGTGINLLITLPAAYALARKDFVGRNFFMGMFVFTMFFSGGLIPTYLVVREFGLINTVWAMLLPQAAAVWNIIICRTFFQMTIPRELQESAEIDGCSNLALFAKVVLPLSAPIIAVMALFYGVMHWNSYFNALIYISDRKLYPLQLILREILVMQEMSASMMMQGDTMENLARQARIADIIKYAVMIVASLPLIIIYPFMQRYFVKGVLLGSLKG